MSNPYDKLQTSRPINAQTKRVMGSGFHYDPPKTTARETWDAPPKMRKAADPEGIVGTRFGRFVVIGALDDSTRSRKKGASWVVRCVCGRYEIRKARAIRNPENTDDRCFECQHVAVLKKRDRRSRLGDKFSNSGE